MNKIKYIHCLGTSYTAGGGFEFDSPGRRKELLSIYKGRVDEKLTQFDFSWPGQLQKLLKKNNQKIKVLNHAKQGYGNERMFRLTFDILNDDININEHLFLLEFSDFGRKEFYCNDINDYIITNFYLKENKFTFDGAANSYWHDTDEQVNKIKPTVELIKELFPKICNEKQLIYQLLRDSLFFINFLILNDVNFLFTHPPEFSLIFNKNLKSKLKKNKKIEFITADGQTHESFVVYFHNEGFQIFNETNGIIDWDGHASLFGNKQISIQIFNKLINENFIRCKYENILPKNYNIFTK